MALTFLSLTNVSLSQEAVPNQLKTTSVIESITDIFSRLFNIGGISHSSKESGMVPNTSKLARDCPELAPQSFSSPAERKAWNTSMNMVTATFMCYN